MRTLKNRKENREKNTKRVELMRDTFLSFVDWETTNREITELEKLTKEDVVRVAKQYYRDDFVVGYRIDKQHKLPSIKKPKIDPLAIDPDKKSPFMEEVAAIPFDPFNPKFVEEGTDYSIKNAKGIKLIHVNPPMICLLSN